ncbi:hypothetical protein [Alkalibacillus aidingensis]|uniref:hypothetical protein n=1 Tax=Alkalibacillus aidingensis TaxID=2747607 RepID=UPI001660912D|nr:hypothetical protein [Alkalibacillus aidingensis]
MSKRNNDLSHDELQLVDREIDRNIPQTFGECLQSFLGDCNILNLRGHTIKFYQTELSIFYKQLREQKIDTTHQAKSL